MKGSDYDPVEALREEVIRFKDTNRFSPMTVTNLFVQAGLTIERLDQLKADRTHLIEALKEARVALGWFDSFSGLFEGNLKTYIHTAKTALATINKALGESK